VNKFLRLARGGWVESLAENRWTSFSSTTVPITVIAIHLAALSALFFRPSLTDLSLFAAFYLATGFGITIGFHRLLTHKGFSCSHLLAWALAFLGTASLQGGPIWWVSVHRRHHQISDLEGDPHTPRESLWHGHMGWMFTKASLPQHPELVRDLSRDSFLRWLDRGINGFLPWLVTAAVCFLVGGLRGVVWGAVVRTVFVWHATWCVNSICHRWGSRPHQTREHSGNVWWVGLWALGEGWHNNHHAHPRAALHKHHWWEIDLSGYVIQALAGLRLVSRVVCATPSLEKSAVESD
jgi:stearoyl-CoA desaturase (delta-9 desaturase)